MDPETWIAATSFVPMALVVAVSGWALTYLLHSTATLCIACAVEKLGWVAGPSARDTLWKAAILIPVCTATLQVGFPAVAPPEVTHEQQRIRAVARTVDAPGLNGLLEGPRRGIYASLHNPTAECRSALRSMLLTGPTGVDRIRQACKSAPWIVGAPWVLLTAWIAGAFFFFVRRRRQKAALKRALGSRRLVTGGFAREALDSLAAAHPGLGPIRLYCVEGLESPAALDRSSIGLPPRAHELSSEELGVALAHELGHIARRDPAWLSCVTWLAGVLFFQPLNRLALVRIHEASEMLADDWAVERTGSPLVLARALATVSEWLTPAVPAPVLAMARADSRPLGRRVERILAPVDRRPLSMRGRVGLLLMLFAAAAWIPSISLPPPSAVQIRTSDVGAAELRAVEIEQRVDFVLVRKEG